MNLSSLNPFKKKPSEPHVWVLADPLHPHRGIDKIVDGDKATFWPNIKVTGIALADARAAFIGKVIEYKRIPRTKLHDLTEGDLSIAFKVEDFKGLFR